MATIFPILEYYEIKGLVLITFVRERVLHMIAGACFALRSRKGSQFRTE
jgi:hypothetical protein